MKNTYSTNLNLQATDAALFILRIAVAAMMLTHGIPKLLMLFSSDPIAFADPIGIGQETSLTLVVFAEVICSLLLLIGLATKLAVIPLIINMAVAFFIVHAADAFREKELAMFYLVVYIFFLLTGAGKYSLDHYFLKNKKDKTSLPKI